MNALPNSSHVQRAIPRVAPGLKKYLWLQTQLNRCDVFVNVDYQRRFVAFYRVRRAADWRHTYFQVLQKYKTTGLEFAAALELIAVATRRVEASFASKLVATIDPNQPVIDSVVLKHVGLRLPPASVTNRLAQIVQLHNRLVNWYREQLASAAGVEVLRLFHAAYPDARVSDTKALDLVLWQIRDSA